MIAIETHEGELVKVFKEFDSLTVGIHKLFGFISNDKAQKRLQARKLKGHEFNTDEWLCQFALKFKNNKLEIENSENCYTKKIDGNTWKLSTNLGEYKITQTPTATIADSLVMQHDKNEWLEKWTLRILGLIFLIIPILYFMQQTPVEEDKEKVLEKITVKVVKPVNTVKLKKKMSATKAKPLTKSQISKRAVKRNLGFLGLVGSKDLTKATGGIPQKLKKATAGAGKGGDAGSGGEVLTGLGKGLKKTTVGNTGVAGLGGVGTKGAGGGKGGYGSTMVASGSGTGISAIAVGSNDLVLDGGLSRYAINATIAKYLSQVRRCYESELNKYPNLEGLVTVAFEIGGSGMLNWSRVQKSSLGSKTVEKCITTKMMKWKFPKPKGGVNVKVDYPFMLRPVGT